MKGAGPAGLGGTDGAGPAGPPVPARPPLPPSDEASALRRIRREFGGELALNCWVIRPGTIAVGDPAPLAPTDGQTADLGGWIVGAPYALAAGARR